MKLSTRDQAPLDEKNDSNLGIDFLEFQLIRDDLEQAMTGISTHKQDDYLDEFDPGTVNINLNEAPSASFQVRKSTQREHDENDEETSHELDDREHQVPKFKGLSINKFDAIKDYVESSREVSNRMGKKNLSEWKTDAPNQMLKKPTMPIDYSKVL